MVLHMLLLRGGAEGFGMKRLRFLQVPSGRVACRKRRLQVQLTLNKRKRFFFVLVCLLLLLIPKATSQFLFQVVPVLCFFKIHLFCHFLSKHVSQYAMATELLLSRLLHSHRFQIRNAAHRSRFCTSSKHISCSQSKSTFPPICSKRSNQAVYA